MFTKQDFVMRQKTFDGIQQNTHLKILEKCMFQMKLAHEKKFPHLLYSIPTYLFGYPKINMEDTREFLIYQLRQKGFSVKKVSETEIFIDWSDIYQPTALQTESYVSSIPITYTPKYVSTPETFLQNMAKPIETIPIGSKEPPLFVIRRDMSSQSQSQEKEKEKDYKIPTTPIPSSQSTIVFPSNPNNPIISIQDQKPPVKRNVLQKMNGSRNSAVEPPKIVLKTNKNKKELNRNIPSFLK